METERTIDGFKAMGEDQLISEILTLRHTLRIAHADLKRIGEIVEEIKRGDLDTENGLDLIKDYAS